MNICIESAIKRIKVYAFCVAGMNRRQLAIGAGLPEGAVRHIHKDHWNPTLSTLLALETVIPADWTFEETPEILKPQKGKSHAKNDR